MYQKPTNKNFNLDASDPLMWLLVTSFYFLGFANCTPENTQFKACSRYWYQIFNFDNK